MKRELPQYVLTAAERGKSCIWRRGQCYYYDIYPVPQVESFPWDRDYRIKRTHIPRGHARWWIYTVSTKNPPAFAPMLFREDQ